MDKEEIRQMIKEEVSRQLAEQGPPEAQAMTIVASKGTLDMAYPVLILATSAAAMELETSVFFTFYGLNIIKKSTYANLKVAPIANPAMPVPMPNILGMLPGMTAMATAMMNSWMRKVNVPTIPELLEVAKEENVRLIACQMTMDVMGIKEEELIDGLEFGGAATYLAAAAKAQINLFV
jgi:peroxiredoxin family protein